jgi:hypothetical protein
MMRQAIWKSAKKPACKIHDQERLRMNQSTVFQPPLKMLQIPLKKSGNLAQFTFVDRESQICHDSRIGHSIRLILFESWWCARSTGRIISIIAFFHWLLHTHSLSVNELKSSSTEKWRSINNCQIFHQSLFSTYRSTDREWIRFKGSSIHLETLPDCKSFAALFLKNIQGAEENDLEKTLHHFLSVW